MFKKLSFHLHKSHPHQEQLNRDSLVDPNATKIYTEDIDPCLVNDWINPKDDHLALPPLTIDHANRTSLVYPSPASIPSPMTPEPIQQPDAEIESLVHQGISFHEKGQLEKATQLFRLGAEKGNPIGMFLYGVSLRHGWGCKKNEHIAFQYLQKAAEHAVEDLANITNTVNTSASKGELIMAIYELGVSFRHGWGCKKNKESAVQFFKIAADLGDPDAQNDLGHCYYQGQGVKKDLYMAAKYYRKADKQGQGIMGNSWIWKSKYDHPPKK
ncbi:uncharacterized protein B0P05DRAFT_535408 [Gilbertella persicaria]|uniref:uncharacterized protein n=1 Tax=Gilbertella persicaria TaxID=101096 RepID=UPI00221ED4EB|nr:uncharacterized protein B0P05DRAFT_535408 [Gilbertella persicaria]KAI8084392.1 hypothetical protein B0P05DRAFT_535408 [Gilbertella persicaria]